MVDDDAGMRYDVSELNYLCEFEVGGSERERGREREREGFGTIVIGSWREQAKHLNAM
jgi:hypothetical protein